MLVTKGQMCVILRVSRSTLDMWMAKFGDEFPVEERGTNGKEYALDAEKVIAFLRAKREQQHQEKVEQDKQLAQLVLPLPASADPPRDTVVSLDDQLKAARLNAMRISQAQAAGALVDAAEIRDHLARVLGDLGRNLDAFVRQLGREHSWPEAVVRATEGRMAEVRRAAVAEAKALLTIGEQRPAG